MASGRGRIYSYVLVNRPEPGFERRAPYIVAIIDLLEGPRMMGNIVPVDPTSLPSVGAELELYFEDVDGSAKLPQWRLSR